MVPVHITRHAIDRYIERIDPTATRDQARAQIASHDAVLRQAVDFGASGVRCPRYRLILADRCVVTVCSTFDQAFAKRSHRR